MIWNAPNEWKVSEKFQEICEGHMAGNTPWKVMSKKQKHSST